MNTYQRLVLKCLSLIIEILHSNANDSIYIRDVNRLHKEIDRELLKPINKSKT